MNGVAGGFEVVIVLCGSTMGYIFTGSCQVTSQSVACERTFRSMSKSQPTVSFEQALYSVLRPLSYSETSSALVSVQLASRERLYCESLD